MEELFSKGDALPVMETFYSIQGEGYHTGKAACFVRIGGCDVGCRWCDSKESWNAAVHPLQPIVELLEQALKLPVRDVVVTGGEPLLYELDPFCRLFRRHGFRLYLETSGCAPLSGEWDWICLSPKSTAPPLPGILPLAGELKVIVAEEQDFLWAESYAAKVSPACLLFLQAEWSRRKYITPLIVRYILDHPRWMLSQQTHKYINIP
ncbi:MAG TPA: 7-carboxy-7-deazaguanine synthase QueE [Bacteroidales bacterium]|nr:7-carboxy-7-deazaguanine synthase QueE [Bacteroidales bacterium]HSA44395.1 7-carboxy-7-deazaguanine synthase QueE [Bacteroidales bacterium]